MTHPVVVVRRSNHVTMRVTIMSATGGVRPGKTFELKKTTAGFDLGRISKYSPRRTPKRNRPVTSMAEASVASIAGISTKAMSQPLTKPTSAIVRMARTMAGGPDRPALTSVLNVVAPATIAATCDRSRPREMMTTAMPQLRMTRDVELDRMTERFPSVAKPGIVKEKVTAHPPVGDGAAARTFLMAEKASRPFRAAVATADRTPA